jgi:threonylcarbamoyladenosine tRNA methylthiotransferase MtaB
MKTVAFYTLGCKLNFSETSTIARLFEEQGYIKVAFDEHPDIFVINTCSVTENADKKCKKIVREAKSISPQSFVTIIGCYAQLKPKEISEIPGVDAVLGASEKFRLLELLNTFEKPEKPIVMACDVANATDFHHAHSYGDRTRTFLKVQDGCNYNCAFCTIPLARGKSRSDSISNIVLEAKQIAGKNVKEVVLSGVNIGDFGIRDGRRKERFIDLLKALDGVDGIDRFRISSIEPNLLSDEIISFTGQSKRFVPHFHIPLQSGSDVILERMQRRYRTDLYQNRIQKIKELMPNACIGVDVITGFPGENENEFLKTFQFLNELPISYLHVFTYSERANTRALELKGTVPHAERQKRSRMLRSLSHKKKHQFYKENEGKELEVLYENDVENGFMHGFTENYLRVRKSYEPEKINHLEKVKLTELNPDLIFDVEEVYSLA